MKYKFKIGDIVIIEIPKVAFQEIVIKDFSFIENWKKKKFFITQRDKGQIGNEYAIENNQGEFYAWLYEGQLKPVKTTK